MELPVRLHGRHKDNITCYDSIIFPFVLHAKPIQLCLIYDTNLFFKEYEKRRSSIYSCSAHTFPSVPCSQTAPIHVLPLILLRSYHSNLMVIARVLTSARKEFQASAAMKIRSAVFWDITQRRVVILYRRFGTKYRSLL